MVANSPWGGVFGVLLLGGGGAGWVGWRWGGGGSTVCWRVVLGGGGYKGCVCGEGWWWGVEVLLYVCVRCGGGLLVFGFGWVVVVVRGWGRRGLLLWGGGFRWGLG